MFSIGISVAECQMGWQH